MQGGGGGGGGGCNSLVPVPPGIRVLLVDDDHTYLLLLKTMLASCRYLVTACDSGQKALTVFQENVDGFDIVVTDVHMPEIDGFMLLGQISKHKDLPVIMISVDTEPSIARKGVEHGATFFFTKAASVFELKNIWQYVFRRMRTREIAVIRGSRSVLECDEEREIEIEGLPLLGQASEMNADDDHKGKSKRKGEEEDVGESEVKAGKPSRQRRTRVNWDADLHGQFLKAISQLGLKKAVPKTILEHMKAPGLTRENIASHLQKYRLYLRKLSKGEVKNTASSSLHLGASSSGWSGLYKNHKPWTPLDVHSNQPQTSASMYGAQLYGGYSSLLPLGNLKPASTMIQHVGSTNPSIEALPQCMMSEPSFIGDSSIYLMLNQQNSVTPYHPIPAAQNQNYFGAADANVGSSSGFFDPIYSCSTLLTVPGYNNNTSSGGGELGAYESLNPVISTTRVMAAEGELEDHTNLFHPTNGPELNQRPAIPVSFGPSSSNWCNHGINGLLQQDDNLHNMTGNDLPALETPPFAVGLSDMPEQNDEFVGGSGSTFGMDLGGNSGFNTESFPSQFNDCANFEELLKSFSSI